tara:strand:- start:63 stop:533 length:471 start_codon:yes stop_codon:yes gene_type:complete
MANTDKRIVYQGENGRAVVVIPAPNYSGTMDDLLEKRVPENCRDSANVVEVDTVPSDRTFRNSWVTKSGESVSVDLDKAKDIAKDKVRQARTPKFQELDILYQRAIEENNSDKQAQIIAQKKTARDATADSKITSADSVANLKTGMEAVIKTVGDL